jgi:hypothetical protein
MQVLRIGGIGGLYSVEVDVRRLSCWVYFMGSTRDLINRQWALFVEPKCSKVGQFLSPHLPLITHLSEPSEVTFLLF